MDIVIQGGVWQGTQRAIDYYRTLPFVDKIIFSTWEDQASREIKNAKCLYNKKPDNVGQCNINLQLVSSLAGIKECTSNLVLKVRSDEIIHVTSLCKLNKLISEPNTFLQYEQHSSTELLTRIYCLSLNTRFPYHPQDHLFFGPRQSMLALFDIPLSTAPVRGTHATHNNHIQADGNLLWDTEDIRPNIYIGAHYCSRFSKKAKSHLEEYKLYLTDNGPKRSEAMQESSKIRDQVFKVLPRLEIYWEKYPERLYPYDFYKEQGEYFLE
jgi:hypothetical protein